MWLKKGIFRVFWRATKDDILETQGGGSCNIYKVELCFSTFRLKNKWRAFLQQNSGSFIVNFGCLSFVLWQIQSFWSYILILLLLLFTQLKNSRPPSRNLWVLLPSFSVGHDNPETWMRWWLLWLQRCFWVFSPSTIFLFFVVRLDWYRDGSVRRWSGNLKKRRGRSVDIVKTFVGGE